MNHTKLMKSMLGATLILAALAMTAGPSFAASYDLAAVEARWLPPGGTAGADEMTMWGFVTDPGSCPAGPVDWQPGPTLRPADASLTINLRNCLAEPVSIVIPGQTATGTPVWDDGSAGPRTSPAQRVRSLSYETPPGGVLSYAWTSIKTGAFLYESGSHQALQVPMGLYGALIVLPAAAGEAYTPSATNPDTAFDTEVVLLYSEIDPLQHDPPAVPKPLDYTPGYYLINGMPYEAGDAPFPAGDINQKVLIRFLNAGLKTHVPTLLNAPHMRVIAEDGNLYPYAKEQYSVLLAAGRTMDAIWTPNAQGAFAMVDRANSLTTAGVTGGGMLAYLQVGTLSGAPTAVDDTYAIAEDGSLAAAAGGAPPGVLDNDTGATSAILISGPSAGSLGVAGLGSDGSFTYTPNPNFNGTDIFTYQAGDGTLASNVATVLITVAPANDAPVAMDDAYAAAEGIPLNVAAPGVLGNDNDVDGDALTVVIDADASSGILAPLPDGSFTYTANAGATSDSFTYHANDGVADSNVATVTITVSAPVNTAPVAVDDAAGTVKNIPVFINLVANDTDAENNLKDALGNVSADRISIVTPPTRGGMVSVVTNGVNFTPKNNFRGTDVFTYTVTDAGTPPLTSNTATVRVNVTR